MFSTCLSLPCHWYFSLTLMIMGCVTLYIISLSLSSSSWSETERERGFKRIFLLPSLCNLLKKCVCTSNDGVFQDEWWGKIWNLSLSLYLDGYNPYEERERENVMMTWYIRWSEKRVKIVPCVGKPLNQVRIKWFFEKKIRNKVRGEKIVDSLSLSLSVRVMIWWWFLSLSL